jgi:hypothetical protein
MSRNAQDNRNNLEFKVRKKDSYKLQSYKRCQASAALNLIRTTLVKAPALLQLRRSFVLLFIKECLLIKKYFKK